MNKYRVKDAPAGLKVRSGPGLNFHVFRTVKNGTEVSELERHAQVDASGPDWIRVGFNLTQGREMDHGKDYGPVPFDPQTDITTGWIRTDYLEWISETKPTGTSGSISLPPPAGSVNKSLFPLPCEGEFTGGWMAYNNTHMGWDIANRVGTLIFAKYGGIVSQAVFCEKCGHEGKSSYGNGVPVRQIYADKGWNGGFGHYVVVRYDESMLPANTRALFPGHHAYVLYGHLSRIIAQPGDFMYDNYVVGEMGNSGNSSGPHVHIEVRFSKEVGKDWSRLPASTDPGVLFSR
jgi:murein DD-endopeptidase MepM/ murein hydrolase activator NlpD